MYATMVGSAIVCEFLYGNNSLQIVCDLQYAIRDLACPYCMTGHGWRYTSYNKHTCLRCLYLQRRESPNSCLFSTKPWLRAQWNQHFPFSISLTQILKFDAVCTPSPPLVDVKVTSWRTLLGRDSVWPNSAERSKSVKICKPPWTQCRLHDPIPSLVFKTCRHYLLPVITRIANLSLTSSQVPVRFKVAMFSETIVKKEWSRSWTIF